MTQAELESILIEAGNEIAPLTPKERRSIEQSWRRTYGRVRYAKTGKWSDGGFSWHFFSFGESSSRKGTVALELYAREHPPQFIVRPDGWSIRAYRCAGGALPDFMSYDFDVEVFPPDLEWTMAFTHEKSMGLGPYYSRKEWQPQFEE
ncbi:MAG: hypothetical protein AB1428_15110 [Bacteroidota bacterium]